MMQISHALFYKALFLCSAFSLLLLCVSTNAQDTGHRPLFSLPVDCIPGRDCWIVNYVDMDEETGSALDPFCGPRSYDNHKGTDFAISDRKRMEGGVDVIAARNGTVLRIRDGEKDRVATKEDLVQSQKDRKECGNAVFLDHGNGLHSMYCHLKEGSVNVTPGQKVKKGERLGQVGLSGFTEFPHVHFGILWEGAFIEPFTGQNMGSGCIKTPENAQSFWEPELDLHYEPLAIYSTGFHNAVPSLEWLDSGPSIKTSFMPEENILTFWAAFFGAQEGDLITIEIRDPLGKVFSKRIIEQDKTRARQFYFVGRRLRDSLLEAGTYTGQIIIQRKILNGQEITWQKETIVSVQQ